MDEYSKKIEVSIDVKPVLDKVALERAKKEAQKNGKPLSIGMDFHVDKDKIAKNISKELNNTVTKYLKSQAKAQDITQRITDMGLGKMTQEEYELSRDNLKKLVSEHKKAIVEMVDTNRRLERSLSSIGVGFNAKGLASIGIPEDAIKQLTSASADFANYEKMAAKVREVSSKFNDRATGLRNLKYGNITTAKEVSIALEYRNLVKSLSLVDDDINDYLTNNNVREFTDIIHLTENQLDDFEKMYRKYERLYSRLRDPDFKKLNKEDLSIFSDSYETWTNYFKQLPSQKISQHDNIRENIKEILTERTDLNAEMIFKEIEAAEEEGKRIAKDTEAKKKENEKVSQKLSKQQKKLNDINKKITEAQSGGDGDKTDELSADDIIAKTEDRIGKLTDKPDSLLEKLNDIKSILTEDIELAKAFDEAMSRTYSVKAAKNIMRTTAGYPDSGGDIESISDTYKDIVLDQWRNVFREDSLSDDIKNALYSNIKDLQAKGGLLELSVFDFEKIKDIVPEAQDYIDEFYSKINTELYNQEKNLNVSVDKARVERKKSQARARKTAATEEADAIAQETKNVEQETKNAEQKKANAVKETTASTNGKKETVTPQTLDEVNEPNKAEMTAQVVAQINEELTRIAPKATTLKTNFEEIRPALEQDAAVLNGFYDTLTKIDKGGKKYVDSLIKETKKWADGNKSLKDLSVSYNNVLSGQSITKNVGVKSATKVPPAATTSTTSTTTTKVSTPSSLGGNVKDDGGGGYIANITGFTISATAQKILRDKVKGIKDLIANISDFNITDPAIESLKAKVNALEGISTTVGDFSVPDDIDEKVKAASAKIKKSNLDITNVTIKGSVKKALRDEISKELGTIEISQLSYGTAVENFKKAKKKTPIKIGATISSFKIGTGAIPGLKKELKERLKNIEVKFKYNLDVIVSEQSKTAAQKQINALQQEFKEASQIGKKIGDQVDAYRNTISSKFEKGRKVGYVFSDEDQTLDNTLLNLSNRISGLTKPAIDASEDEIKAYIDEVNQISEAFKNVKDSAKITFEQIDKLLAQQNSDKQKGVLLKNWNTLFAQMQDYLRKNPRISENATYSKTIKQMLEDFQSIEPSQQMLDKFKVSFSELKVGMKQAGLEGKTFGQNLKAMFEKFGSWGIVTRIMMLGYNTVKKMFTATKEVDTSMVNLRKVSDETEESYTRFLRNATKEAKELGTTITELTEATATFARLGYNLADSTELGKIATMYSKVAENLSPEEASNSIISTMKAFKIGADEAERIVDEFNYVGEILPLHTVMYVDQMAISVNVRRRIRPR